MAQDLNSLLKALLDHEIEFVLIGGFASVIHGSNHVTQDLDICAVLTSSQIDKLRGALAGLHPIHRMNIKANISFADRPAGEEKVENIYLQTDAGILDILSNVTGVGDFNELKKNAISVPLFGAHCLVMSLDDLIKSKEMMPRNKDKIILDELIKIRNLKIQ
jgi:predicted nucleotidyltransferase